MSDQGTRPLSPRQELLLRLVVEAHIESGQPVGSKSLVQAGLVEASSSTVRAELAELEERGMLEPSAHLGRARAHRGGLSPLCRRARAGRRARGPAAGRPVGGAPRARRRAACHHRGAREHDPAARRRLRALPRHDRGPPRRAPAPAAERRDGRRDHRDRRRREAPLRVRGAGRLGARRLGDHLPR